MLAKFEKRVFAFGSMVWVGKYRELKNRPHWHFENELIACKRGNAIVTMDGTDYELRAGMCFLCMGEHPHHIASIDGSRIIVAQYDNNIVRFIAPYCITNPLFSDHFCAYERLNAIYHELIEKKPFYTAKVNASLAELMIDIYRWEKLLVLGNKKEPPAIARYKELLNQIDLHYDSLTFSKAALFMNMSNAYFSRYFKCTTGMTFSRYLNAIKIDKAIDLMATSSNLTMADVMSRCGFNTLRNFNRVFKEITGFTPSSLPANYTLNLRALSTVESFFDPTIAGSQQLT